MDGMLALLDQIDHSRERILVAIESLPDEALLEPAAVGRFSVAQLLALQAAWEAELVTGLMRLEQGQKPEQLLALMEEPEAYEARRLEEYQGRDLDRIFADWQQVRVQLETWLDVFSERDLASRKRFKWLHGRSLRQVIMSVTVEQETAAARALAVFARRWLAEHDDRPSLIVPLSAVSASPEVEQDDEKPD